MIDYKRLEIDEELEFLIKEELVLSPIDFIFRVFLYLPIKSTKEKKYFYDLKKYIHNDKKEIEDLLKLLEDENLENILEKVIIEIRDNYKIKRIKLENDKIDNLKLKINKIYLER